MSQPHLLRASGPAFKLGTNIVKELNLKPVSYHCYQPSIPAASRKRNSNGQSVNHDNVESDYKQRKNMSANIFKYFILANNEQLEDMKLNINDNVRQEWKRKLADTGGRAKTDDVGDALLHALTDILCGSSNFRQLVPSVPSLYNNRTIAISVFPDKVYWVVLLCSWNSFLIEDLDAYDFMTKNIRRRTLYRSLETVDKIIGSLPSDLNTALKLMNGGNLFTNVDHIKVVIKQQSLSKQHGLLTPVQAGALTNSTVAAMKKLCDEVMTESSNLITRKDKIVGSVYMRVEKTTKQKYQVSRSAGKHTNAILCCLGWFQEHMKTFIDKKKHSMSEDEKCAFFKAIRETAEQHKNCLEMIHLSDKTKSKISSGNLLFLQPTHTRNFADVLLIALNNNQQHVKSVADNSNKMSHTELTNANKKARI